MSLDFTLSNGLPKEVVSDLAARGFRGETHPVAHLGGEIMVSELVATVDSRKVRVWGDPHQVRVTVELRRSPGGPSSIAQRPSRQERPLAGWGLVSREVADSARLMEARLDARARAALNALTWAYQLHVTSGSVELYELNRDGLVDYQALQPERVAQLIEFAAALEAGESLHEAPGNED